MRHACRSRRGRMALTGVALAGLAAVLEAQPMDIDMAGLEQHRRDRAAAAHRPRRIMFNNDGDDHLLRGTFSREAFLAQRSTAIVGSQVDTLVYCTSRPFGLFLHDTQIGDTFTAKERFLPDRNNIVADLFAQGTDPLKVMVEFCRENGLELIWSMRMNDTHDAGHTPEQPHHYWSDFKENHPEALVGALDRRPPHGTWVAVDYADPRVRDFLFRIFEELCQG